MGLSFPAAVAADFMLGEFAARGEENADGWGLGWYPDGSLALLKEPVRWRASALAAFLESYAGLRASIYIAHVRYQTTGGAPTHADSQPFMRELRGRDYCFAHNGTVEAFATLELGRYRPVGGTDSEHLFCHLMDALERRDCDLDSPDDWRWLHERLAAMNRLGTINCLFSDGRRLFAYHDRAGHKGLCVQAVAGSRPGLGFASCPLGGGAAQPVLAGELIVLEAGSARFSSHRDAAALS